MGGALASHLHVIIAPMAIYLLVLLQVVDCKYGKQKAGVSMIDHNFVITEHMLIVLVT